MMTVSFARIASWSGWARLPASVAIAGLIFALIGSLPGGACRALAGLATGAMALSDAPHVQSLAQSGLHLAFMAEVRRNGFGGLVGTVVLAGARGFFEGGVIGHVVAVVGFALTRSLPMSMAISGVGIVRAALQDRDRPTRCIIAAIATITGLATTINPDLIDTVANVVTAAAVIASVGALVKGPRLIGGIGIVGCVVSYAPIKHLRLAVGSGGLALLLVCYTVGVDGIGQDPSGSPSKVDKEPSVGSTLVRDIECSSHADGIRRPRHSEQAPSPGSMATVLASSRPKPSSNASASSRRNKSTMITHSRRPRSTPTRCVST